MTNRLDLVKKWSPILELWIANYGYSIALLQFWS